MRTDRVEYGAGTVALVVAVVGSEHIRLHDGRVAGFMFLLAVVALWTVVALWLHYRARVDDVRRSAPVVDRPRIVPVRIPPDPYDWSTEVVEWCRSAEEVEA